MEAATNMDEANNPFLLPGVGVHTTPTSHFPISQQQIIRYSDGKWLTVGTLIDARPIIAEELKRPVVGALRGFQPSATSPPVS